MANPWEVFAQYGTRALNQWDEDKQAKRLRALTKIKGLMEYGDVGSPVDDSTLNDVSQYASELNSLFDPVSKTFKGTAEQQRINDFRNSIDPNEDPDSLLRRGFTAGAVSPGSYANYVNSQESARTRMDDRIAQREFQAEQNELNRQQRADLHADSMENQRTLRATINANSNRNSELTAGTRADNQKKLAARQRYHGNPLTFLIKDYYANPQIVEAEKGEAGGTWEGIYNAHLNPEVREKTMQDYGLDEMEYDKLLRYFQGRHKLER